MLSWDFSHSTMSTMGAISSWPGSSHTKWLAASTPWASKRNTGNLVHPSNSKQQTRVVATFDADLSEQISGRKKQAHKPQQILIGVGSLVACEKGVGLALSSYRYSTLPSSTLAMALVFCCLLTFDKLAPDLCTTIISFFTPGVETLQRWMPLFYAPPLALLPLDIKSVKVTQGIKLLLLTVGSWAITFLVTGLMAFLIRRKLHTKLEEATYLPSPQPFTVWEILTLLPLGAASLLLANISPTLLGNATKTSIPFFAALTVVGFLIGSFFPRPLKRLLHPAITCAIFVNAGAILYSFITKQKYASVLGLYLGTGAEPGAGRLFMALLGPLAVSYAFVLYRQRRILQRHLVELSSVVPAAGSFSMFLRAFTGRNMGLDSHLTSCVVPSSLTFAFSLPISDSLQGSSSLAVLMCILTGLLGAHLSRFFLSRSSRRDLVVEGITIACSSHGYGSAAIAAEEPDLLPLTVVSYILMGAFCSLLCLVPITRKTILMSP